jgi:PAS domain S-box-containing protein
MLIDLHPIYSLLTHPAIGPSLSDTRATFVVAVGGAIRFVNAAGARLLGVTRIADALGRSLPLEDSVVRHVAGFASTAEPGRQSVELIRFVKGTKIVLVQCALTHLGDLGGAHSAVVAIKITPANPADADIATSLALLDQPDLLLAAIDPEGDVLAACGEYEILRGAHDEVEATLAEADSDPIVETTVTAGDIRVELTVVRVGGPAGLRIIAVRRARLEPVPFGSNRSERKEPAQSLESGAIPYRSDDPIRAGNALDEAVPTIFEGDPTLGGRAAVEPTMAGGAPTDAVLHAAEPHSENPILAEDLTEPFEAQDHGERLGTEGMPESAIFEALAVTDVPEPMAFPETQGATDNPPVTGKSEAPDAELVEIAPAASALVEAVDDHPDFNFAPEIGPRRFVWQTDENDRFSFVSDDFAAAVGPRAADIVGLTWPEVAERFSISPDRIATSLRRRDTWSGRTVLWPIDGEALRVPVDLAALPAFGRGRAFEGFRGFGICRTSEAVPDPLATGLRLLDQHEPREPETPLPSPSPLEGEGARRADEGTAPQGGTVEPSLALNDTPHPAVGHLLPQGEKAREPIRLDSVVIPVPSRPDSRVITLASAARATIDDRRLTGPERLAFRQIADALGARIEGEDTLAPATEMSSGKPPKVIAEPEDTAAHVSVADEATRPGPIPPRIVPHDGERLLQRLPIAMLVVKDQEILFANDAALALLGYSTVDALVAEGGLEAMFAGAHAARHFPETDEGRPMPLVTREGAVIPVWARLTTVQWEIGTALLMTIERAAKLPNSEATAARGAIETLNAARERVKELEAIVDTATDGVLMLDTEGTVISANRAAETLFGSDRAEMAGRPLVEILAPESRRSAQDYLDGLARNGVASVLNDGREVIGQVQPEGLTPLFMTIGRISSDPASKFCAVLRDITQWKKSEEELTAARRRAEEASVHKSEFLAKISHEIRTPLNAIIGFSEVMLDERFGAIGNDRYRDYLRDIHVSGSHIMSLINDLLDLSKVEAGKLEMKFEAVALAEILGECVAIMQPQANRERIIIRTSLPTSAPPVVADPRSIRQIVLNLLSNAVKFTPAGGQVIVSITLEDNGEVVVRVRDTGFGMSEKEIETALEPFRQLHTARVRGGGTGLGLPLTKALVEANRATFRIDSAVNQGTLVSITFPVTRVLGG